LSLARLNFSPEAFPRLSGRRFYFAGDFLGIKLLFDRQRDTCDWKISKGGFYIC